MDIKTLRTTDENAVILPGAVVSGDVTLGKGCFVLYNAVIRGDAEPITVGENTNIQDNCVLHTSFGSPLCVGSGVTVGHAAILHGCTIGDNTLIGMGSIVLDNAVVGKNCVIGAGSLVTGGSVIPDGCMAFGRPARFVRQLRAEEIEHNRRMAEKYCEERELYR